MENSQETNTLVVKIVGEFLVSNQANSFWRKTLIVETEEKPSVLFLIGFQRILSDTWGNFAGVGIQGLLSIALKH